jgi:methionine synthase II (cobalamin-independent)
MAYHPAVFATLAGGYPTTETPGRLARPRSDEAADALVHDVVSDQVEAGLGLVTDGGIRWPDPVEAIGRRLAAGRGRGPRWRDPLTVPAWAAAARIAGDVPVKQCLPGPYSLGLRFATDDERRPALTLAFAEALAVELEALTVAGCPFIQVDEDGAVGIGLDETERALFREAHRRLLAAPAVGSGRPHLSLAVSGGNADLAGPGTILVPPYDSHFFDLLAGPDNWRLVTRIPTERGVVLGVVDARRPEPDDREVVVWAVGYAAASADRGEDRVGIAPSASLAGLPRSVARQKIGLLGEVVGLIERRHEEPIATALDPRAVDLRSSALGRWTSRRPRPPSS